MSGVADQTKTATRVAGGYKAAINNPRNTEEGKERARESLQELEESGAVEETQAAYDQENQKEDYRVNAGYKATMKNPNVSQEAKDHAREILEEKGAI